MELPADERGLAATAELPRLPYGLALERAGGAEAGEVTLTSGLVLWPPPCPWTECFHGGGGLGIAVFVTVPYGFGADVRASSCSSVEHVGGRTGLGILLGGPVGGSHRDSPRCSLMGSARRSTGRSARGSTGGSSWGSMGGSFEGLLRGPSRPGSLSMRLESGERSGRPPSGSYTAGKPHMLSSGRECLRPRRCVLPAATDLQCCGHGLSSRARATLQGEIVIGAYTLKV